MTGGGEVRLLPLAGASEWVVTRGPRSTARILFVPPLFEELNRCRRLIAEVGRRLAARGIGSWLPDLPATGESDRALDDIGWDDWRAAIADAAAALAGEAETIHLVSIRGGALIDDAAMGAVSRWRLAPVDGTALWRDLARARLAVEREGAGQLTGAMIDEMAATGAIELAGYPIPPALSGPLRRALPAPPAGRCRHAALTSSPGADVRLPGPPPWRQTEPDDCPALAEAMAADIAGWIDG